MAKKPKMGSKVEGPKGAMPKAKAPKAPTGTKMGGGVGKTYGGRKGC